VSNWLRPVLRLFVGPACAACFAAFELRGAGEMVQAAAAYGTFVVCVLLISVWGACSFVRPRSALVRAGQLDDGQRDDEVVNQRRGEHGDVPGGFESRGREGDGAE